MERIFEMEIQHKKVFEKILLGSFPEYRLIMMINDLKSV